MFYLLAIFYCISLVNSFTYTIDATLQLGPKWEYKFNIKAPENAKLLSRRNAFQQNRAITSQNDDISSSEDKSEVKNDVSKEERTSNKTNLEIDTTKNPSARNKTLNNQTKRQKINQPGSNPDDDLRTFEEKEYNKKTRDNGRRSGNSDDSLTSDDNDGENTSFQRGFTQPLIENQKRQSMNAKIKNKSGYRIDSVEMWHPTLEDIKETKKNKKKHKRKSKSREKDNFEKPQSDTNNKNNKTEEQFDDSQIIIKDTQHHVDDLYKNPERLNIVKKNDSSVTVITGNNQALSIIIGKIVNKTQVVDQGIKNKTINLNLKDWKQKFKNEIEGFIQNLKNMTNHQNLKDLKQKFKNKTNSALLQWKQTIKNRKNKTKYVSPEQPEEDWTFVRLKNINYNDFYSTPAVLLPTYLRNTDKISKISQNVQKVKDDTIIGFANLYKELNQESQRIKDNATINSFTKDILQRTLKLFDNMEKKSTEYRWKKKMKYLARSYEDKFNEFLRATRHHKIRTRLGARKVILNAIDVSNRIVDRLVNFMANDMEKRGLIYSNLTPVMFRAEINKEEEHELQRACAELGICKTQKGFTHFITDMLLKMLRVTNDKFKSAFNSMVESARRTDFAFSPSLADGIKKKIDYCGRQNVNVQRGMIMIVKNIVANRNRPLVLYADSNPSDRKLQSTLAFLEIINTLDEKVPNDKDNVQDWDNMSREMDEWVQGRNENIQSLMSRFVTHISNVINDIDINSWQIVTRNAEILFS